ncbi:MAG: hypothetical protein EOO01_31940, partial [Chitinophagaceae bacterium]
MRFIFLAGILLCFFNQSTAQQPNFFIGGTVKELHGGGDHRTRPLAGVQLLLREKNTLGESLRTSDGVGRFNFSSTKNFLGELLVQYQNWTVVMPEDRSLLEWRENNIEYSMDVLVANPAILQRISDSFAKQRLAQLDKKYLGPINSLTAQLNEQKMNNNKLDDENKHLRDA